MKKKLPFALIALAIVLMAFLGYSYFNQHELSEVEQLKQKHASFLENSPFKETKNLSRSERKALGLPPNAYHEQMWELTMDPSTGRPMPELVMQLQQELRATRQIAKGAGGDGSNPWINRGPNDQGGRTRGILFDPNDVGNADPNEDYNRVFAGGVSGGLWVNEDITDENESWTLVPGIGANIRVTVIVADPNDSNVFYIGSGESYVSGFAVGRGIWKSEDAGVTWELIFGDGVTSVTNGGQLVNGIFYVNDIVIRDNNGVSEVYASIASAFYRTASSPNNFNGADTMGLYKSVDGGENWSKFDITHNNGNFKNPNDIELDLNNNIWFTTTRNVFGDLGGDIYKSTDGVTFTLEETIPGARRTELEVSSLDANKFWVVVDRFQADIFMTDDGFATITQINEPNDVDVQIPANDYARNQAFYNLPIEVDMNDKLYIGGIDLFTSTNDGTNWEQISKWSNNNNLINLNVPLVHADHHAIVFRPGTNDTQAAFANDGGVYYSSDVNNLIGNPNGIQSRNKDYITTQYYYGTINPVDAVDGDDIAGGTQDNGTQILIDGNPGLNPFIDPFGGDGAYTEIDDTGSYIIQSFPFNVHTYRDFPSLAFSSWNFLTQEGAGEFINTATLDKNLDVLYSDATTVVDNQLARQIERVSNFLPTDGLPTQNDVLSDPLLDATPTAMKVSPFTTSSSKLFVGLANGRLLRIDFANLSVDEWTDIAGPNFVGSISDIEFGQTEDEIFVTMHNYGVTSIWFTNNGGAIWRNREGNLPEVPVKCILQNPLIPSELIIGTELGVWGTADYEVPNPNWIQLDNGMSDVTVLDLDLRESDNVILASTHGRGFFTSQFTSDALSVFENNFENDVVSIFPTVSDGNITIKSNRQIDNASLEIFNLAGQVVYRDTINLNNIGVQININANSGIYLIKLSQGNFSETKKIIIQ
ncbi:MAG: T9SS type A sorting domain-containing protein [Bacteroidota bacterium]